MPDPGQGAILILRSSSSSVVVPKNSYLIGLCGLDSSVGSPVLSAICTAVLLFTT